MVWFLDGELLFDDMFSRFDTMPACDGQTDGQTERRADILRQHSPRYALHRAVKINNKSVTMPNNKICTVPLRRPKIHRHIDSPGVVTIAPYEVAGICFTVAEYTLTCGCRITFLQIFHFDFQVYRVVLISADICMKNILCSLSFLCAET